MITRLVKLTIDPLKVDEFLNNFDQVKNQIRLFDGCMHLELLSDTEAPGVLFTYSIWDSQSSFENYRDSELFRSTWRIVKPLFTEKAEAWSLERIADVHVRS